MSLSQSCRFRFASFHSFSVSWCNLGVSVVNNRPITTETQRSTESLRFASQSQPQRVQLDESFRVTLVVNCVGFERRNALVVERIRRAATDDDNVPTIELKSHFAGHGSLCLVNHFAHQLKL